MMAVLLISADSSTALTREVDIMKKFRVTFNAPVTLTFVLMCFAATLSGILTGGVSTQLLFSTYHSSMLNPMTYVRFFTHVLGHMGWSHFIGNASYLLLLGPMLEEKYGSQRIAGVIAVTALATGLVNYIFFWNVALCGASGVVFAFILMASFTGFREGEIPLTFILVAVIYIGQQVYEGLTVQDNISNMAHIVGGMVGSVLGYKLNRRKSSIETIT
jgi:GlpG protein